MIKNKYIVPSRISEKKSRELIRLFALDIKGTKIASLTGVSHRTIIKIQKGVRERIAEFCEADSPFDTGEVEINESFFGTRRVRGKHDRGTRDKHIVFGLIKRKGKVYTQIVKNCSTATLLPIIKEYVNSGSDIYTDGFKAYDGLVDVGYKKHHRVIHSKNEFPNGRKHINGIENFWGLAKTRLSKFRGIHKSTFYLHLKECEFRFNYRHEKLYQLLLKIIREKPLKFS